MTKGRAAMQNYESNPETRRDFEYRHAQDVFAEQQPPEDVAENPRMGESSRKL